VLSKGAAVRSLRFVPLLVCVGIVLLAPGLPASAGFPGPNGKIVFTFFAP
jgi:hypothetical protein